MAGISITKRTVDAAKPAAKDHFLWDNDISGFGLKVTPAGGKIYVYQYRIARPGEAARTPAKRYTIGKHGNLTPDEARKRAKELAALVERGVDPRQRELDDIAAKDEAERLAQEKARIEGELAFGSRAPAGQEKIYLVVKIGLERQKIQVLRVDGELGVDRIGRGRADQSQHALLIDARANRRLAALSLGRREILASN